MDELSKVNVSRFLQKWVKTPYKTLLLGDRGYVFKLCTKIKQDHVGVYTNMVIQLLYELGVMGIPSIEDTVLWRIRIAIFKCVPVVEKDYWEFLYQPNGALNLQSRPNVPSKKTVFLIPKMVNPKLTDMYIKRLLNMGINLVSYTYLNGDVRKTWKSKGGRTLMILTK